MAERILIIGASGRAAAFSALRAGLRPTVIDLFGDEDLRAVAEAHTIERHDYPDRLPDLARRIAPMPWMYTGGLENHPEIVGAIARDRRLLGNGPEVLNKVRDPMALMTALTEAGLWSVRVRPGHLPPTDGLWLEKALFGSGGSGIRFASSPYAKNGVYFQEFIAGESQSAVFRNGRLIGVTRQLVGQTRWLHAPQFGYCGSIGPVATVEREDDAWEGLGEFLMSWAGLTGYFGIDAIVRDGLPWIVEVNPRYTASMEVIEYACILDRPFAKAVYYAPRTVAICDNEPWENWRRARNGELPEFADIPRSGSVIGRGRPVVTIFGRDEAELRAKADLLDARFAHAAERVGADGG